MGQKPSTASSPLFVFDVEMSACDVTRALEYVSRDLRRKRLHVHLIVGGDSLPCVLFKTKSTCRSLNVLPVSSHSPKTLSALARSIRRAQKTYGLGGNWINPQLETEVPEELKSTVIQQSLLQNEIIFSSEGLTLFAIDHRFSLKFELDKLSRGSPTTSYDGVVDTLRRLVYISRGRPMTRGFIGYCYPTIDVGDQTLLRLNAEYEHRFGHRGVVGVNDEYMGWRRDGLTWSAELEEYGRELAFSLSRSSSGCSSPNNLDDKPLPPYPPYYSDTGIADIFSSKPLYN